jgi:long-subunit acyl-CoA synthetase (AMP-forming)
MNKLTTFIIELIKMSFEDIALICGNTKLKYKEMLGRAIYLAFFLITLSKKHRVQLRIAIVANNSIEWVIVFLAAIFSDSTLILISTNLNKIRVKHILNDSNANLIFTDQECLLEDEELDVYNINSINTLETTKSNDIITITGLSILLKGLERSEKLWVSEGKLVVYTPRDLKRVEISYTEIVSLLSVLGDKDIFNEEFVVNEDFSTNYILCLLLPLLSGVTLNIAKYLIPWIGKVIIIRSELFNEWLNQVFTYNDFKWYHKFINFISFGLIGKWLVKRSFNQTFPNLKKLIILNSSLSYQTEKMLKRIKFPYTITYGTTETMGIATYSDPSEFKIGSVGKVIMFRNIISFAGKLHLVDREMIPLHDIGYKDAEGHLFLTSREDEVIHTEQDLNVSRDIEKIFKSVPVIEECYLLNVHDRIYLLVNLDKEKCESIGLETLSETKDLLRAYLDKINKDILMPHEQIHDVVIEHKKFPRDLRGNLIRNACN